MKGHQKSGTKKKSNEEGRQARGILRGEEQPLIGHFIEPCFAPGNRLLGYLQYEKTGLENSF